MATLSFSPETSISSHTLSISSAQPPPMELQPASASPATSLAANPLAFLQPTMQLSAAFLAAAKRYLDPVASGVSEVQILRQQEMRKKRKRGYGYDGDTRVLHLKKVHLEGFGINQVFEQTRKIVEATAEEIELALPGSDDGVVPIQDDDEGDNLEEVEEHHEESSIGEEGEDWEYDGIDDDQDARPSDDAVSGGEDVDMEADDADGISEQSDDEPATSYKPDPNGLNDGFFSLDDFNKQSEFLEQQDQRGEAADDEDDEVDWTADPMAGGGGTGLTNGPEDVSDDKDDEGGPTFGNADLNAPEGDSDDDGALEDGDLDVMDDAMNANNVLYADFFAPPARKVGKNSKKRGRPNPQNFPAKTNGEEAEAEDVEGTMARVHRDLFEDDDDAESNGDLSDADPSNPKSRKSTHERRQAKIAEEIRKLEAANVAKREWQVSGEARAADRPLNSLLEENLEFERAGKPVPIATAEVSEDIEALIKRRILAGEFDEVLRRRPDDLATGPKVRRGQMQLDDTKSGKGLAEMYEEEYLRTTDPNFVDAKDEKLKKEHDEIAGLWKSLSVKLDSLSSSHFKPKPAAPNLEIRVDAPAIEMEDARPTAGGDVAGASMLAPQEVYKPGDEKSKTEIVTKSGLPIARDELSREEKSSRRRRAKERSKKEGLNKPKTTSEKENKGSRGQKKQLLGDLKKGGVQIIGRKGVLTNVEGKEAGSVARKGAGSYKL